MSTTLVPGERVDFVDVDLGGALALGRFSRVFVAVVGVDARRFQKGVLVDGAVELQGAGARGHAGAVHADV